MLQQLSTLNVHPAKPGSKLHYEITISGTTILPNATKKKIQERLKDLPPSALDMWNAESPANDWCDDVTTKAKETCAQEIALAFDDAVKELKDKYGSDWKDWRWGDAHHAVMAHLPFENIPVLRSIFSRDIEASGGAFTLRRGDYKMTSAQPYAASHASGFRALMDLKNPDNSLYVIATGESGNVFSDHYDDLMLLWAKGEYVRIPQTQAEVERVAQYRLELQPANNQPASAP
jgi:penicillin amidase